MFQRLFPFADLQNRPRFVPAPYEDKAPILLSFRWRMNFSLIWNASCSI